MSEQTPTKPKEKEDSPEPRWIRLLEILLPQLVLAGIFLYGINAVSKRSEEAQINNAEAQAAKAKLDVNEGSVGALQIKGSVQFGRDYSNFNADQRPTSMRRGTLSLIFATAGRVPVEVSNIEFTMRKGKLPIEWKKRLIKYEFDLVGAMPANASQIVKDIANMRDLEATDVLLIAHDLDIWEREPSMRLSYPLNPASGKIFPNQDRPLTIDFLVCDGNEPELLMLDVEITMNGSEEKKRRWSTWIGTGPGLRQQAMQIEGTSTTCLPIGPFDSQSGLGPSFGMQTTETGKNPR